MAYDAGDSSLWTGKPQTGNTTLYQYDTSGNLLQSPTYAILGGYNVLGGEFGYQGQQSVGTPEPSTLAGLGIGTMIAVAFARRRKAARAA